MSHRSIICCTLLCVYFVSELSYLKDLSEKAKFGRQLARNSSEDVRLFFSDPLLGSQRTAILFLFTYHTHPKVKDSAALINGFLCFEQAVLLWRQRHARLVETFIGRRPGTGGSSGVEYIDATAQQYRIFTDIWRIRSLCVARTKLDFDPDDGAVFLTQEPFLTDLAQVEADIKAETQAIKDAAAAAAIAAAAAVAAAGAGGQQPGDAVRAAAAGPAASSSTAIAAGIGPGAAGQTL